MSLVPYKRREPYPHSLSRKGLQPCLRPDRPEVRGSYQWMLLLPPAITFSNALAPRPILTILG